MTPNDAPSRRVIELASRLGSRAIPDAKWVAQVMDCAHKEAVRRFDEIAEYEADVTAMTDTIERTGRSYYAQFPTPIELFAFVRMVNPKSLLESGVSSGVSTTFLLLGVKANRHGLLVSIDLPEMRMKQGHNESWAIPSGLASGWAIPDALRKPWRLRTGRSEDLLAPILRETENVDLFCHDSPVDRGHLKFELDCVAPHLRSGSLVVADNCDKTVFAAAAGTVGARAFFRKGSSLGAFRVP
jgi:Methyltransferase domain